MKVGFAQINTTVGDFDGNGRRILAGYDRAVALGAEIVLAPELATTGYPPQDLVLKSRFVPLNRELLERLADRVGPVPLVVGFVGVHDAPVGRPFRNSAAFLVDGGVAAVVHKSRLPTYDVFDEDRYFEPATENAAIAWAGGKIGLTICEDIWFGEYLSRRPYPFDPAASLAGQGIDVLLNISASPFTLGKPAKRRVMLSALAARHGVPVAYCNLVGGNDQLVFDGHSLAVAGDGRVIAELPGFREETAVVDLSGDGVAAPEAGETADLFGALVLGLRDYLAKCGFRSVVLGLSGGIDSAVTAAVAVEALGAENVLGVALPSRYSSEGSLTDAGALAANLGIRFETLPIGGPFEAVCADLAPILKGEPSSITAENLQPRLRSLLLMALSNEYGHLLLTTGNKSELAVGYCTIYGDMAGGLAVLSDVLKTRVYELARWINRELAPARGRRELIPQNSIEKPPSAELKPGQTDQDTLPPYDLLDRILELYVERHMTAADIVGLGFDGATVRWVARRVDLNEYKRRQAAPGIKVSALAFGMGRRVPIAQRFVD
jgi:NAD+ synthetase